MPKTSFANVEHPKIPDECPNCGGLKAEKEEFQDGEFCLECTCGRLVYTDKEI